MFTLTSKGQLKKRLRKGMERAMFVGMVVVLWHYKCFRSLDTSKHCGLLGQVKSSGTEKTDRTTAELADEEKRPRKPRDSEIDEGYKEEGMVIPNKGEGWRWETIIGEEEVICGSGAGSSSNQKWWKPDKRGPNMDFEEKN